MSADVHYQQNVVELTTSSTDGDNLGGKWDRLLRWLESKGMDTSDLHVRPSTRPGERYCQLAFAKTSNL